MARRRGGRGLIAAIAVISVIVPMGLVVGSSVAEAAATRAGLVNMFAGSGPVGDGPDADLPLGMIQWGPDTSPHRVTGSGYTAAEHTTSGLSLTHAEGTGCNMYGDIPILPVAGTIGAKPATSTVPFDDQTAVPGRYGATFDGARVELGVTTRTGLASLAFRRGVAANVLFKVSGSADKVENATVNLVGSDEVTGSVTAGAACTTGTNYTVYFSASFNHSFEKGGTWKDSTVSPATESCEGPGCGGYVTFADGTNVEMKIGISFVSVKDAQQNLLAEDPDWSLPKMQAAATGAWDAILGRLAVTGGTNTERRTFETALYHSLLYPSVESDVTGAYPGGKDRHGTEYTNFSEWDIYRSQFPLLCMLDPTAAGDMVESLIHDAAPTGWLPKWAMVDGDLAQMNGDSADPIIATAYAYGVRNFDARAALADMEKGADTTEPLQGFKIERQYLKTYLVSHFVGATKRDLDSITYTSGSSMTLEYATDDFSIAELAGALGDTSIESRMMARAHNWEYLLNPATNSIQGKLTDGAFPTGPVLNPSLFEPGGEQGFEEGNADQYNWAVPQDLSALSALEGGNAATIKKLNAYFTQLNGGRNSPFDWSGNEPSEWSPWVYDSVGDPAGTQTVVRRIMTSTYSDSGVDEPGNDDLGAIASWYVWAAIGLYPLTPGTANLDLGAPLFQKATVTLANGHHLTLLAHNAGDTYVSKVQVMGGGVGKETTSCASSKPVASGSTGARSWDDPWVPSSFVHDGATLTFSLGSRPTSWGTAGTARPPSYAEGRIPAVGFADRPVAIAGSPAYNLTFGIKPIGSVGPVHWSVSLAHGVSPTSGTFPAIAVPSSANAMSCRTPASETASIQLRPTLSGSDTVKISMTAATGAVLPPVVLHW